MKSHGRLAQPTPSSYVPPRLLLLFTGTRQVTPSSPTMYIPHILQQEKPHMPTQCYPQPARPPPPPQPPSGTVDVYQ